MIQIFVFTKALINPLDKQHLPDFSRQNQMAKESGKLKDFDQRKSGVKAQAFQQKYVQLDFSFHVIPKRGGEVAKF